MIKITLKLIFLSLCLSPIHTMAATIMWMGNDTQTVTLWGKSAPPNPQNSYDIYEEQVISGNLSFDKVSSTGSGTLTASNEFVLSNLSLTENTDGSVLMSGEFDYLQTGPNLFEMNLVFDYSYDEIFDVTIYDIWTLDANNDGFPDSEINSGAFAGNFLELSGSVSFLAYVENEFPVYNPVPVPAAVWLFSSGLLLLAQFRIKKRKYD